MYFAPSPEFMKFYKTDKVFKETVLKNVKKVFSEPEPSTAVVEDCIDANERALNEARNRENQSRSIKS